MIQVFETVRVVRSTPLARTVLFATVLSVQPSLDEDNGSKGEPTITIGIVGPDKKLTQQTTVRHVSHDEVQTGATEWCWTDVLGTDGGPIHLQGLNMKDLDEPVAEADEPVSTIGTIVYINHSNGLDVFHGGENMFRVHFNGQDHDFSDLFSAKVFVDAQEKPEPKSTGDQTGPGIGSLASIAAAFKAKLAQETAANEAEDEKEKNDAKDARDAFLAKKAQEVESATPSAADLDANADEQKAKEATSKSSGDDQDAGAWTEAGDGTEYPGKATDAGSTEEATPAQ